MDTKSQSMAAASAAARRNTLTREGIAPARAQTFAGSKFGVAGKVQKYSDQRKAQEHLSDRMSSRRDVYQAVERKLTMEQFLPRTEWYIDYNILICVGSDMLF